MFKELQKKKTLHQQKITTDTTITTSFLNTGPHAQTTQQNNNKNSPIDKEGRIASF